MNATESVLDSSCSNASFDAAIIETLVTESTYPAIDKNRTALKDLSGIRGRWLSHIWLGNGKTSKLNKSAVYFYGQILRTYPQIMSSKDQLPPIIHPWQISTSVPVPIANCRSLVHIWEDRANGSTELAIDSIRREMSRLFKEVGHH